MHVIGACGLVGVEHEGLARAPRSRRITGGLRPQPSDAHQGRGLDDAPPGDSGGRTGVRRQRALRRRHGRTRPEHEHHPVDLQDACRSSRRRRESRRSPCSRRPAGATDPTPGETGEVRATQFDDATAPTQLQLPQAAPPRRGWTPERHHHADPHVQPAGHRISTLTITDIDKVDELTGSTKSWVTPGGLHAPPSGQTATSSARAPLLATPSDPTVSGGIDSVRGRRDADLVRSRSSRWQITYRAADLAEPERRRPAHRRREDRVHLLSHAAPRVGADGVFREFHDVEPWSHIMR